MERWSDVLMSIVHMQYLEKTYLGLRTPQDFSSGILTGAAEFTELLLVNLPVVICGEPLGTVSILTSGSCFSVSFFEVLDLNILILFFFKGVDSGVFS